MRNGGLVRYALIVQANGKGRGRVVNCNVRNSIVGRSGSSLRIPHFENAFELAQGADAAAREDCSGMDAETPSGDGVEDFVDVAGEAEAANETQRAPMVATALRVFSVISPRFAVVVLAG
jgi:hypothetical protein